MNERSYHPQISQVKIIRGRNNFPISWLNTQNYCEYSLYLENVKGVKVAPTTAMNKGTEVHSQLEKDFKKDAVPATIDEMLETSKTAEIFSREVYVESPNYGIRGMIDEIWLTPDEFIIIDDKPGNKAFPSQINQVFGYCLAFKDSYGDGRKIVASLRTRDTEEIFWSQYYDERSETEIKNLLCHMHDLISGNKDFMATKNPNKCRACRFSSNCDRKADL
jgi:CRISPR-associated exonuclease Cas4